MELKKSASANTENQRVPILLTGMLFVGSLVLASFSYTAGVEKTDSKKGDTKVADNQYVVETQQKQKDETPPPPQVDAPPPPAEEIVEKVNTEKEPEPAVPVPPPVQTGPIDQPKIQGEIIDFPDVEATFPGGAAEMQKWINANVQYPQTAIEMNEQGRVYLSFVVEPDGSITNVEVERGVSPDLDREAKRVVTSMPKWKAGKAAGKSVRTRCRLPIIFTLE